MKTVKTESGIVESFPQFKDDRTEEQKQTHCVLWGGTDSFLSGWGCAENRQSFAFWACRDGDGNRVERWVRHRGDIKRVRQVMSDYRCGSDALVHIYVVDDNHPAMSF